MGKLNFLSATLAKFERETNELINNGTEPADGPDPLILLSSLEVPNNPVPLGKNLLWEHALSPKCLQGLAPPVMKFKSAPFNEYTWGARSAK